MAVRAEPVSFRISNKNIQPDRLSNSALMPVVKVWTVVGLILMACGAVALAWRPVLLGTGINLLEWVGLLSMYAAMIYVARKVGHWRQS